MRPMAPLSESATNSDSAYNQCIQDTTKIPLVRPMPILSHHRAVKIAEEDAQHAYHNLATYRVDVRLGQEGWVVVYHFRGSGRFHTGGGPHYLIHPETGEILTKKYYQ